MQTFFPLSCLLLRLHFSSVCLILSFRIHLHVLIYNVVFLTIFIFTFTYIYVISFYPFFYNVFSSPLVWTTLTLIFFFLLLRDSSLTCHSPQPCLLIIHYNFFFFSLPASSFTLSLSPSLNFFPSLSHVLSLYIPSLFLPSSRPCSIFSL